MKTEETDAHSYAIIPAYKPKHDIIRGIDQDTGSLYAMIGGIAAAVIVVIVIILVVSKKRKESLQ